MNEPDGRLRYRDKANDDDKRWVYIGIDNFMGEITYEFVSPDGRKSLYLLPANWTQRFEPWSKEQG